MSSSSPDALGGERPQGVVVFATYNEAGSIRPVLEEVAEAAAVLARGGIGIRILLVDDRSPDGTAEIARGHAAQLGLELDVLSGDKAGLGAAVRRGLRAAVDRYEPDFVVNLDADGQHDARQMPDLIRAFLARGSGITIGSRWAPGGRAHGMPLARKVLSRVGNVLVRSVTGLRDVSDATTSFRVLKPEVIRALTDEDLAVEGYAFFSSVVVCAQVYGFAIDEIPIVFRPRYSGVSNLAGSDMVEFARNLFRLRRHAHELRRRMRAQQETWVSRSPRFAGQEGPAGHQAGFAAIEEMESLAQAERFLDFVCDEIASLGDGDVLEVGAGMGPLTKRLSARVRSVTALEPAANVYPLLVESTSGLADVTTSGDTLADFAARQPEARFDVAVYVNVLEHIRDDAAELALVRGMLRPGGRLFVFVPAMPGIYGTMDYASGHWRRYTRESLLRVVEGAGFRVDRVRHFDPLGVLPYWLLYRRLGVKTLDRASTTLYDRVIVPVGITAYQLGDLPVGKNLIAIATAP